jgi:hypothetical protein
MTRYRTRRALRLIDAHEHGCVIGSDPHTPRSTGAPTATDSNHGCRWNVAHRKASQPQVRLLSKQRHGRVSIGSTGVPDPSGERCKTVTGERSRPVLLHFRPKFREYRANSVRTKANIPNFKKMAPLLLLESNQSCYTIVPYSLVTFVCFMAFRH